MTGYQIQSVCELFECTLPNGITINMLKECADVLKVKPEEFIKGAIQAAIAKTLHDNPGMIQLTLRNGDKEETYIGARKVVSALSAMLVLWPLVNGSASAP